VDDELVSANRLTRRTELIVNKRPHGTVLRYERTDTRSSNPHDQARVGHPPIILAVDRGFSTRNNEASGAGRRRADRRVAPFGLVTSELRYFEHRASF